jgi:aryl-alcohol dehydrogenase (NADP+)
MLPLCVDAGVGALPWSPLARGRLARFGDRGTDRGRTDAYARQLYDGDDDGAVTDALGTIARARGLAPARVALAWLLGRPAVVAPIVGATRPEHIDDAVGAVEVRLTEQERAALEASYRPKPVRGHQ